MKYSVISMKWYIPNSSSSATVYNKTYEEALDIAKQLGYVEPKWYQYFTHGKISMIMNGVLAEEELTLE